MGFRPVTGEGLTARTLKLKGRNGPVWQMTPFDLEVGRARVTGIGAACFKFLQGHISQTVTVFLL